MCIEQRKNKSEVHSFELCCYSHTNSFEIFFFFFMVLIEKNQEEDLSSMLCSYYNSRLLCEFLCILVVEKGFVSYLRLDFMFFFSYIYISWFVSVCCFCFVPHSVLSVDDRLACTRKRRKKRSIHATRLRVIKHTTKATQPNQIKLFLVLFSFFIPLNG